VDPVLIILGLILGLLPWKPQLRLLALGAIALLRAALFPYDSAGGLGDFIISLIIAAANLGIGLAIGMAIGLAFEGRGPGSRSRPRFR
jgi:hypothetical protein